MQIEDSKTSYQHGFRLLVLVLLAVSIFFVFQAATRSQTDFYNNLWAPAHLLTLGESPYDTASLQPELPALWMPTAVGFFSFLGFFDFETAQQIWFALNSAGLAVLIYLSLSGSRSIPILLVGLFLAYFFPPTINHFALGQVSILAVLCLLMAVKLLEKNPWLSALFLALGLVKPQIGILVLFGVSTYQYQQGGFQRLFRYGLQTFLAALFLCLPLFIAEPDWFPDFIASLQANTLEWTHPTILSQLDAWLGNWKFIPWGILLLGVLRLVVWMWRQLPSHVAALWTLALTVLVTPYVWSWDFVLLLPAFAYIFSISNWKGRALLVIGYCLAWAGMAVIQLSDNFHNSRFWWVTAYFIVLLVIAAWLRPQSKDKV